ncbi:MAG: S-methyl-5-thioribose-1-phosphate isomerase [Candidatus Methanomethyliaceae archaeon]|nr:S-methyl-5-thioribose-1-phosphate isomerase [Candidatus Methanomethyliaceae archaeon]MDW7971153.1 S-methyl-5-thioribose-1-phosphate isomerase [Nitrososphaerota archaeon]
MRTIEWREDGVYIIDQTKLPHELSIIKCMDYERIARAIENMEIRGAPAIGVAAAMGIALAAKSSLGKSIEDIRENLERAAMRLAKTRPTAKNLFWALERLRKIWINEEEGIIEKIIKEALSIAEEDVISCRKIGEYGSQLIEDGDVIMTYCNAGGLACVELGTALGVIKMAFRLGKRITVFVPETRPLLQGARLTAFELKHEGIPFKLITDNMVGYVMQKGMINKVIVGADRITRYGDIFNKIGTYTLALIANAHNIPFYVAAPISTIDLETSTENVIIEERDPKEVLYIKGVRIAPEGIDVMNPAFDMTPARLISAIITDVGIFKPPYDFASLR